MNPSASGTFQMTFGWEWENIAIASFVETRRFAVRAQKLGKLHHDATKGEADLFRF